MWKIVWLSIAIITLGAPTAPILADEPTPTPPAEADQQQPGEQPPAEAEAEAGSEAAKAEESKPKQLEVATFGAGCFWCVEAVFQRLKGVEKVVSGYSGGSVPNPTYKQVLTGATGHAEVTQITFDPDVISFTELLEVFWKTHDPTTLNRQGPDVGPQYRSIILYHNVEQRKLAEYYKERLNVARTFNAPVVTEIAMYEVFYPAEAYHQNYYLRNRTQPYCQMYIAPKLRKFQKVFADKIKK